MKPTFGKIRPEVVGVESRPVQSDAGTLVELFRSLPNRSYVYGANSDVSHLSDVLAEETTHRVEDAGHFPMVDDPDLLYEIIGDDLRRIAVNA